MNFSQNVWIISGLVLGLILLFVTLKTQTNGVFSPELPTGVYRLSFAGLLALFAFLITFRVTEIPVAFNVDEAGTAYDALSIANYHVDRFLYHFPVYFINYGGHGSSGLYTYLAALMIKIFGYGVLSVRLPAVLLSIFSALALSLTVKKELGSKASLITIFLFCVLPFSFMHSRWGLDAYLFFPMLIFSVTVFYRAVQSGKTLHYFLSGIVFGITLYSYSVSFMVVPVLLGVNLIYLLVIRKISWKDIIVMGLPLFLLAVPLMLMLAINNGYLEAIRTRFFSIPQLISYGVSEVGLKNIFSCLKFGPNNVFYNIFVNDNLLYNVVPAFGTVYYVSIPLFLYGFFLSIQKLRKNFSEKRVSFDLIILTLFLSVLFISMIIDKTNVNRSSGIYIAIIYFLTLACLEILKKNRSAAIVTAGTYVVLFGFFLNYYFTDFSKDLDSNILFASISDLQEALEFSETVYREDETVYVLGRSRPYIYTLLALRVDPYTFQEKMTLSYDDNVKAYDKYRFHYDGILPDCIYIFHELRVIPEELENGGFNSKLFGSVAVYYPVGE